MRRRIPLIFILLLLLLASSIIAGISLGSADIAFLDILRVIISRAPGLGGIGQGVPDSTRTIILDLRLPVVVMALFAGAGLSASGASMQGLFKNPLVDPFIIGISAGGAMGWVMSLIMTQGMSGPAVSLFRAGASFLSAMAAVLFAYAVSRSGHRVNLAILLLSGVAVSALLTSATQVLIYLLVSSPSQVIFSLMGSCANSRWSEVALVAPVVALGTAGLVLFGKDLNAFSMGEEDARGLGVNVERSKMVLLALSSLISAISIPFCGMIGFVGLIVPHICRRLIGPDHRVLLPASALLGASFLIICDLASRTMMDVVIPLGMITGLVGGSFFVYLLLARRVRD